MKAIQAVCNESLINVIELAFNTEDSSTIVSMIVAYVLANTNSDYASVIQNGKSTTLVIGKNEYKYTFVNGVLLFSTERVTVCKRCDHVMLDFAVKSAYTSFQADEILSDIECILKGKEEC